MKDLIRGKELNTAEAIRLIVEEAKIDSKAAGVIVSAVQHNISPGCPDDRLTVVIDLLEILVEQCPRAAHWMAPRDFLGFYRRIIEHPKTVTYAKQRLLKLLVKMWEVSSPADRKVFHELYRLLVKRNHVMPPLPVIDNPPHNPSQRPVSGVRTISISGNHAYRGPPKAIRWNYSEGEIVALCNYADYNTSTIEDILMVSPTLSGHPLLPNMMRVIDSIQSLFRSLLSSPHCIYARQVSDRMAMAIEAISMLQGQYAKRNTGMEIYKSIFLDYSSNPVPPMSPSGFYSSMDTAPMDQPPPPADEFDGYDSFTHQPSTNPFEQ